MMVREGKQVLRIILPIVAVLVFSSAIPAAGVTRIMPLGDSITRGWYGSSYAWGYRKPLYVSLTNGGYEFDFVGSKADGSFPDPNHEGHDGWHANEILNGRLSDPNAGKLESWLNMHQPDVILLHIGTNDITWGDQDVNEVNEILNVIDDYEAESNKVVTVILALIINRNPYNYATTQFNGDVNNMALNRIAGGDDIIIVDMESALYYPTDMSWDGLHPNDSGYAKMAGVWYNALADYFSRFDIAISGYVVELDGNTPVEGVLIQADDNDINTVTDANGYYELRVDCNWSGIVTPQREGYVFEPNGHTYADVNQDYNDMNYTATLMTFKISGFVLEPNLVTPINDVNVSAENGGGQWTSRYGGGASLTDVNGYYEVRVDYNWSGNAMPAKLAYVFEPNSRYYADVNEDYTAGQGYTGALLAFRIAGYIKNECNMPIGGVLVDANNNGCDAITDVNGFYEVWVDYNWSGMVTPTKRHYTFDPGWMSYVDVLADQFDQNYAAGNICDLNCDGYIDWSDFAVMADNWLVTGSEIPIPGDFDASGRVDFVDFADFAGVWGD